MTNALNKIANNKYPNTEGWFYKGRFISIHRYPSNEGVLHALSLGIPVEDLNYFYCVLVYDGPVPAHCHMNVPSLEQEDYAIRKEIIEAWIEANLKPLSFWRKVFAYLDVGTRLMCRKTF